MSRWQIQEAKAHLSEMVKEAITQGPQEISLRGEPVAVVISIAEYEKLKKPKPSFIQFLRQSPLVGTKLTIKRNRSSTRNIDL